ncbi:MAG: heavy-metal-associated domain-containing protein [Flavisolibacter sp.]
MKKYRFKTNINCSGCVAKTAPFLQKEGIHSWEVDTLHPDKILTVETRLADPGDLVTLVQQAGYRAELLDK